jgi:serine protease Do
VATPAEIATRLEALKKDERKSALMLLSNGSGELRFVALRIAG